MSRFTDQMYRQWMAQNGSQGSRRRGGMGGVPPMVAAAPKSAPGYSRGAASAANDDAYSRPEKQDGGYVDKQKN